MSEYIDGRMEVIMARNVAIGIQDFENVIKENCFYVIKTAMFMVGEHRY